MVVQITNRTSEIGCWFSTLLKPAESENQLRPNDPLLLPARLVSEVVMPQFNRPPTARPISSSNEDRHADPAQGCQRIAVQQQAPPAALGFQDLGESLASAALPELAVRPTFLGRAGGGWLALSLPGTPRKSFQRTRQHHCHRTRRQRLPLELRFHRGTQFRCLLAVHPRRIRFNSMSEVRCQTRPRTRSMSRPRMRSPSARRPLCSYSSVTHGRRPRIATAVSSAKRRSTYRSLT